MKFRSWLISTVWLIWASLRLTQEHFDRTVRGDIKWFTADDLEKTGPDDCPFGSEPQAVANPFLAVGVSPPSRYASRARMQVQRGRD